MCQATIYVGEREIAREVIWLEQVAGGVRVATFFDEPVFVRGRVRRIDFLKHRVLLEPVEESHGGS